MVISRDEVYRLHEFFPSVSREAWIKWYGRSPLQNSAVMQSGVVGKDGCSDAVGPQQSKESHADAAVIASEPSRMHTRTAKWTNVQNYRILAWRSPPNGDRGCPSHLSHHCRSNVRGTSLYSNLWLPVRRFASRQKTPKSWTEMCLQQRLQRLLVLKRNTSEITTTAWSTTLSTKKSRCWAVPVEGFFANGTSLVVKPPSAQYWP